MCVSTSPPPPSSFVPPKVPIQFCKLLLLSLLYLLLCVPIYLLWAIRFKKFHLQLVATSMVMAHMPHQYSPLLHPYSLLLLLQISPSFFCQKRLLLQTCQQLLIAPLFITDSIQQGWALLQQTTSSLIQLLTRFLPLHINRLLQTPMSQSHVFLQQHRDVVQQLMYLLLLLIPTLQYSQFLLFPT